MKVISTVKEMQEQVSQWKSAQYSVGLVPTMGFFHKGHLSLMKTARDTCDKVVTSLFVNPMQFGENEDLDSYPRDQERDCALAQQEGVDVLFVPGSEDIYPKHFQTKISVTKLSQGLCGADRPGHFDGVATVVAKLFNIVNPDVAVFGQKDFQQLALIKQLVKDLNFQIEIIGNPIVREADGLAMSSRNKYLNSEEREVATCLYRAIQKAKGMLKQGGVLSFRRYCENVLRIGKWLRWLFN